MNSERSAFPPGKAVLFNGPGKPFEIISSEIPPINDGEILVKTLYTTLCGSDIHTYCGRRQEPPNVVLGHEIVGSILWLPDGKTVTDYRGQPVRIGDRITWSIFAVPAHVEPPRKDMPQKSDQLFKYGHTSASDHDVFNGGLADYCILRPNTAFIKLSTDIPLNVAATISCAHATVAGAMRIAGEIVGKKSLVFGAGLLGLSCTAMCKEAGASWVGLIDTEESRLKWGHKFGADETFLATGTPSWPEVDVVFDMTGSPDAMKSGLNALAVGGSAIWIGAVYPAKPVDVDAQQIVRKLLTIKGLHNYNYDDFVNAAAFIENNYKYYAFSELVEKEYVLEEVELAFKFAHENKPIRVGIKLN